MSRTGKAVPIVFSDVMDDFLKKKLKKLAEKYETYSFCEKDPSIFLYWYDKNQKIDVEIAAFIAAMLSFGNRKQFLPKIEEILKCADSTSGCISKWILNGCQNFPVGTKKFYRFYSFDDLHMLFNEIRILIGNNGDSPICFGNLIKQKYLKNTTQDLALIISEIFINSKIVPKGRNSAKKRIYMFLRWMVRQNSPVDLGIWDWYPAEKLIIPLDTHVIQESVKLGLLEATSKASIKTAIKLTNLLKEVFPEDPCRCDFALFGLGISES